MKSLMLVCVILGLIWSQVTASDWTYDHNSVSGPEHWKNKYPDCGGVMQSPINIATGHVVYDETLKPFDFSEFVSTDNLQMKLENIGGHTAELIITGRDIYLKGGSLPDSYKLRQVHFHVGFNNSRGSEHTINNRASPLEGHFVSTQRRFPTAEAASSHPYGLAVIGILFKEGRRNPKYDRLLEHFSHIQYPDNEIEIPTFSLSDLLPSPLNFTYYRYHGSLTTPPCYETVIWSVDTEQVELSSSQINTFRSLFDEKHNPLVDDYRPVQPLHQRTVTTNKKPQNHGRF